MDSEEPVCPVCGQPVETVVRRHKTLGAWVPKWEPGPCRNPECEAYDTEGAERPRGHGRAPVQEDEPRTGQPAPENS
ncbi:hypothetical protein RKD23_002573 [Streptomyces sp. SAI-170]|uniref:hypothetical protein n=1 Tax=Streptomyces sp. SAI-170 TaxID=3377729 RepID=UPI003C7B3413